MIKEKTWQEFKECGMLWWINMILHTFGWAIVIQVKDGIAVSAFPARVKFRGFAEEQTVKGYIDVSTYMMENAEELEKESKQ